MVRAPNVALDPLLPIDDSTDHLELERALPLLNLWHADQFAAELAGLLVGEIDAVENGV